MKSNISQLAKQAKNGDARAFGEIYSLFSAEMYRYALYLLSNESAAQDAVQDAALEAWKGIDKLKNEAAAKAWIFAILNRCCKHKLREKYIGDFTTLDAAAPLSSDDTSGQIQLGLDLLRLLETLTKEEKDIVLLSAVCGLNSREIAKITAKPAATVRSKLSRALTKLRTKEELSDEAKK